MHDKIFMGEEGGKRRRGRPRRRYLGAAEENLMKIFKRQKEMKQSSQTNGN